jgi:undecaprenyl diphosphate synthase
VSAEPATTLVKTEVLNGRSAAGALAAARMRARNPEAEPDKYMPDVSPERIPRHIAIIMDGNGRWATSRGMPRHMGHVHGATRVRDVVEHAARLGVEVVTLYSFSLENWRRPAEEVEALMHLCLLYLDSEEPELIRRGIRFRVIGRRDGLPPEVVAGIDRVEQSTAAGTRGTLCVAINYGSRAEITDAVRSLAADVKAGRLNPEDIDESTIESRLYTAGLPDPDLLIRTGGEMRVSNYLLWQISYTELCVTPVLWPDFLPSHLEDAVRQFATRSRRFGAAAEGPSNA